jgi:dienelactone hydrolase
MPAGRGPFPAVVLVQGSGPLDRDETIGPNKPFRDLAVGLAADGVAVLRCDKRTKTYANQMAAMIDQVSVKEETEDDALSAAALLRTRPGIDPKRVFLLGHSLGGSQAPRIGLRDPELAGFILLAGSTLPLEDLILEQTRYLLSLKPRVTDADRAAVRELEAQVARVKDPALSSATPRSQLPLGLPAAYWLDLRGYDPAQVARRLDQKMLILQGGRDYMVTMANFNRWQTALAGRPNVHFKTYPSLNHLFIGGTGTPGPADFDIPGHVPADVTGDIAAWIRT